jgi:The GLUG motif
VKRVIFALLVIAACSIPSFAKYSGGTGEPNTPYQIATASDLNDIGNHGEDFNKCFIITSDINMAEYIGTKFSRIGTDSAHAFKGVFDGNGHTISGFTYTAANSDRIGIFGYIDVTGKIENVSLVDVNVRGRNYVGGLIGYNKGTISYSFVTGTVSGVSSVGGLVGYSLNGTISNCYLTGTVSGGTNIGGLMGQNNGNITNSYSAGNIAGQSYIGGLVGNNNNGTISDCYSTGAVTGIGASGSVGWHFGGLVGYLKSGSISDCYSTSTVSFIGSDWVPYNFGGLVGYSDGNIIDCYSTGAVTGGSNSYNPGGLVGDVNSGIISNCYSTCSVTGGATPGGLIGIIYNGTISNCYSTGSVGGFSGIMGGLLGYYTNGSIISSYFLDTAGPNNGYGTPLTDTQMKQQASFIGWDFVWETANGTNDVWAICEGVSYPKLAWQFVVGDSDNDKNVDFTDFALLAGKWMQSDSNLYCGGKDLNGDGLVNLNDLTVFAENWLQGL